MINKFDVFKQMKENKQMIANTVKAYNVLCPKCKLILRKDMSRMGRASDSFYKKLCKDCQEKTKESMGEWVQ